MRSMILSPAGGVNSKVGFPHNPLLVFFVHQTENGTEWEFWFMSLRNHISALLHGESFSAEPSARDALKHCEIDENLRTVFARRKRALGTNPRIELTNARRWRLIDGHKSYLIKDLGDYPVVIREIHPAPCGVIESAIRAKVRYDRWRWETRQMTLQCVWAARKRWVERPPKLHVNIGSGSWYVPDWKNLDYRGPWYNFYAPWFIDYPHDLTDPSPLPFATNSVHLFYCEHVIEHLKDEWCAHLCREALRSLEPGGGFRVVMPDADLIYRSLVNQDEAFFRSWMERDNSNIQEAFCTLVAQSRYLEPTEFAQRLAALSQHEFLNWCKQDLEYDWKRAGEHINWFDFEKLANMLQEAGFRQIRRSDAQQSQFPEIRGPKFDTRPSYSLHVDCVKE